MDNRSWGRKRERKAQGYGLDRKDKVLLKLSEVVIDGTLVAFFAVQPMTRQQ
jgi:hypothetical protein